MNAKRLNALYQRVQGGPIRTKWHWLGSQGRTTTTADIHTAAAILATADTLATAP